MELNIKKMRLRRGPEIGSNRPMESLRRRLSDRWARFSSEPAQLLRISPRLCMVCNPWTNCCNCWTGDTGWNTIDISGGGNDVH